METTLTKTGAVDLLQDFTAKLNSQPMREWLKKTPDNKAEYIPIGILENQLREDFNGLVQYEVLSERRELNEYIVSARIKVFHPVLMQWLNYDGIGAVQIMQDSGASISQFNETKKKNALQMNAPKAYAEAIKNAAKKIGKKYGADVNRQFEEAYVTDNTIEEVTQQLSDCSTLAELNETWQLYPDYHTNTRFKHAFTTRKNQIV
ncbi:MAG: hypothetical protein ACK566_00660 [Bacteroidota bacterium]|jgi:hypothetical protein